MSVMVTSPEMMDAIYNKLVYYNNNKQVDVNYNHSLRQFVYNNGNIKQLVKDWLFLNEWSYIRRYRKDLKGEIPNLDIFLTFSSTRNLNPFEMVKCLEFLEYNIEIETIKFGYDETIQQPFVISDSMLNSYNILLKILNDCKSAIISNMTEYKAVKWEEI